MTQLVSGERRQNFHLTDKYNFQLLGESCGGGSRGAGSGVGGDAGEAGGAG